MCYVCKDEGNILGQYDGSSVGTCGKCGKQLLLCPIHRNADRCRDCRPKPLALVPISKLHVEHDPKVVVLCGSSRFVEFMAVTAWLLEREEGAITMALHLLPWWYHAPDSHLAEHEGCAEEMDRLHLRKIDLCHEIFVVDFDGYIGDSTCAEIGYAREHNIHIRYFSKDPIGKKVLNYFVAAKKPTVFAIDKAEPWKSQCPFRHAVCTHPEAPKEMVQCCKTYTGRVDASLCPLRNGSAIVEMR